MAAIIVIDAGHGGSDPGAVYYGRQEKDDNLRLALAVGNVLKNNGLKVVCTRTQDVYDSPNDKAKAVNQENGDYFVSIHRNSTERDNSISGVITLLYDDSGVKARIARRMNMYLEEVGFKNLGVSVRPNLVVLRDTEIPSILVEVGFINSDIDNLLFDSRFNEIVVAIADAIIDTVREAKKVRCYVQTGLYYSQNLAQQQLDQLWALGYPANMECYIGYYRLLVGPYSSLNQAVEVEQRLRSNGFSTLVIQND